ncbi:MAG: 4Fe-4S single cluster domain-containing protein [Kofleriaceae bacterium]
MSAVPGVLRVATIVAETEAEGPGRRFAVWLQGCSIRCPGCCNPEMFDERRGEPISPAELAARIPATVEGVTLLGGEPFEQASDAAELVRLAKARGLTCMVFSGYTIAELRAREGSAALLAQVDLLVDGRYDRDRPEPKPPEGRRWIGSANQTMHYLTSAYAAEDPRMHAPNTIEIRISANRVLVNGWPSADRLLRRK